MQTCGDSLKKKSVFNWKKRERNSTATFLYPGFNSPLEVRGTTRGEKEGEQERVGESRSTRSSITTRSDRQCRGWVGPVRKQQLRICRACKGLEQHGAAFFVPLRQAFKGPGRHLAAEEDAGRRGSARRLLPQTDGRVMAAHDARATSKTALYLACARWWKNLRHDNWYFTDSLQQVLQNVDKTYRTRFRKQVYVEK